MSESRLKTVAEFSTTDFRADALNGFYQEVSREAGSKRSKLYRAMLRMIEKGFWNPGDRLPTDIAFTEILPLSLATVQAALKMLADQDIVVRKKREGTYVASEDHLSRELVFFRFTRPGSSTLELVEDLDLTVTETGERGPWTEFLGKRQRYTVLKRTITIGSEFRIRSEFYFADPKLRVLLEFPPDSLLGIAIRPLLQFHFGMPTIETEWQSSFAKLDNELADELKVSASQIGQQYDVKLRTIGNEPLAYHRFWVPPNQFTMLITPVK